jgi:N-acetylglucosamine kinase-like BadF-type ATPase
MVAGQYPLAQVHVGSDVSLITAAARSASGSRDIPDWIMRQVDFDGATATSIDDEPSRPRFVPGVTVTAKLNGCLPVIAIIAGTGSIVWADDGNGRSNRWGGLGPVIGDIGSGCWLGQQAIQAAWAELEQRGTVTELLPMLLRHYQVPPVHGRPSAELLNGRSPSDLALLAPLVIDAAQRDVVAADIVQRGLNGLAALAFEAAKWSVNSSTIAWALGGGVLTENSSLTEQLVHKINADLMVFSPSRLVQTCLVVYQPVWGAVLAAAGLVSKGGR